MVYFHLKIKVKENMWEKKIPKGLNFERLILSAEGVVSKIIESIWLYLILSFFIADEC